jgi:phenylalanyl-tRNA synthetase beta chain
MPVITLYRERLEDLIPNAKYDEICKLLPYVGLDIEDLTDDYVKVEYTPNRPDLSTDYGVARALKGLLGIERGIPKHEVLDGNVKFIVDPSVKEVRPYVAGFVVRGLKLDDETIRQIISMQEDLHEGMGRRRKKLAIGLHDASPITPPITYTTVGPDFSFVPLNEEMEMSVKEILDEHPTGIKYGHIVKGYGKYPILIDSKGVVLSLPPIINGNVTRLTSETRDMMIDLTGTDEETLADAAAILAEALMDAGGVLERVTVSYPDGRSRIYPVVDPRRMELRPELARDLLGINLGEEEIMEALRKCRFDPKALNGKIEVEIPRYRVDILHEVDLIEEIGYGYGYHRITPLFDFPYSHGSYLPSSYFFEKARETMLGLGYMEVVSFTLLSSEVLYGKLGRNEGGALRVEATKSKEHEFLRDTLLPGLLLTLSYNIHEPQPHKLFEVGEVFYRDEREETGIGERVNLSAISSHANANYTEIKSALEAFLRPFLERGFEFEPLSLPYLFEGRGALLKVEGRRVAVLGELHPSVLRSFGLRNPASFFELDLETVMELWERGKKRI